MTLLAAVIIFAFSQGLALVIPPGWVAIDPPLLAVAWWTFGYATGKFADGPAVRHGLLIAVIGASIGEAGVVAGLITARWARLTLRRRRSRRDHGVADRASDGR